MHLFDANGTTAGYYTYDAWGNQIGMGSSTICQLNPLRYRGYVYDTETGFYYLQSRYYNPKMGRFINADGLVTTGQGFVGNNMFAYCNNNPVNMSDPTGKIGGWIVLGVILVCGIIGGALGATTDKDLAQNAREASKDDDLPLPPAIPVRPDEIPVPSETDRLSLPDDDQLLPVSNDELTIQDRISNTIIGATAGVMVGGAVVFLGGAALCIGGYATVIVPALGLTGIQTAAWGMIAFDVFPIIIGPFLGMEIEPLEYPS